MRREHAAQALSEAILVAVHAYAVQVRDMLRVQLGWRRCSKAGGNDHLWNTETTALLLYDLPEEVGLRGLPMEDCPSHRRKRR